MKGDIQSDVQPRLLAVLQMGGIHIYYGNRAWKCNYAILEERHQKVERRKIRRVEEMSAWLTLIQRFTGPPVC